VTGAWVAEAAAPTKRARYAGKTRQDLPVSFRVSRSGKKLVRFRVTLEVECSGGDVTSVRQVRFRQATDFIQVNRDDTFSGDTRIRGDRGDEVRGGRLAVNGRFVSRRRARGSLHERLRVADGLRCDSGRVRFTVRRR
jgi:hypothetical protein